MKRPRRCLLDLLLRLVYDPTTKRSSTMIRMIRQQCECADCRDWRREHRRHDRDFGVPIRFVVDTKL